jgi:hypothetical protein
MTPLAAPLLAIDLDGYFLPRYVYGAAELAAGRLPLWNASELAGVPLLGTAQAAALYPPVVLLFGTLPPMAAIHAFMLLHYVLLSVGTFVWMRQLGLARAGAALGALVVTFQPFMMHGGYAPHWVANFAWTPLVLASGLRTLERPALAPALGLVTAASMQVLAGYPEYALDTALVLGVFAVVVARSAARTDGLGAALAGWGRLAAAAGCVVAITAVQWTALLETVRESVRAAGDFQFMFGLAFDRSQFDAGARGWLDALGLLVYLPPLAWVLLAVGVCAGSVRYRGALLVVAVASFAIPTWGRDVPPFSFFRGPLCWHSIVHLPLGALAGAGLDRVLRAASPQRRGTPASRRLAVGLVGGALALSPLLAPRALAWLGIGLLGLAVVPTGRRVLGTGLVLVAMLGTVWTWVPQAQETRLHRYAAGTPAYHRVEARRRVGAAVRAACGRFADGRVLAPVEAWFGVPLLAGLATPQGYPESLAPHRMSALLEAAGLSPQSTLRVDRARLAQAAGMLRLLDVRCIVPQAEWAALVPSLGFERTATLPDGRGVFVGPGTTAFLPREVVSVPDEGAALAAVSAPDFEPAARAFVLGSGAVVGEGEGRVERVVRPHAGRLVVTTTVPAGGYLVVSETWYPGWRAHVDGRAVAVERADYALLGVRLSPGATTVDLWYEPQGFRAAMAATAAGLVLLALGAVVVVGRRRPR